MIIIADSGSTKTDWVVPELSLSFESNGYNPFFMDSEAIERDLKLHIPERLPVQKITQVFYYGAGCSTSQKCLIVEEAIKKCFQNAEIFVEHDLLGAARAVLGNEEGIALIMGTGSNACVYNGLEISKFNISLGFHLGDDGSGGNIAKRFLIEFLNDRVPESISAKFTATFGLEKKAIIDQFYRLNKPNQWVASFAPFVISNKEHPFIAKIIRDALDAFFENQILRLESRLPISAVGSIAFYLEEELKQTASSFGFEVKKIVKNPIVGLEQFHGKKV